jgi:hypothetical protein
VILAAHDKLVRYWCEMEIVSTGIGGHGSPDERKGTAAYAQTEWPPRLVGLLPLIGFSAGSPDVSIALIDGPLALDHPDISFNELDYTQAGCVQLAPLPEPSSLALLVSSVAGLAWLGRRRCTTDGAAPCETN